MKTQTIYIPTLSSGNLEKKENQIVLTLEELNEIKKKVAGDAFEAGYNRGSSSAMGGAITSPDKSQYIDNLIKN
ncbi:MAG: hypothetical protein V4560_14905 [Bacteroidota bacterium]